MEKVKDIRNFTPEEMTVFLKSFDTVLSDCDGVLWHLEKPIDGALETLKNLRLLGKRVLFVSNNSTVHLEDYLLKLKKFGFSATADQIIIPSFVILWYLRKINFQGKALVIGTKALRRVLEDGGISTITPPTTVVESIDSVKDLMNLEENVGAVIFDFDINLSWSKIFQASLYLQRKDTILVTGGLDRVVPASSNQSLLGIGQFVDILVERTGKNPIDCGKPSKIMEEFLLEHYKLDNPKKCIFIGDSLASDMKFAESCGFAKLWVGSGINTMETCLRQKIPIIADYYLPNLGCINQSIKKISANYEHCQRE